MPTRIKNTQKNIQELLQQQPQYVITTSEFSELKQDMERTLNRRKTTPESTGPTLRRPPKGATEPIEDRDGAKPDSDDERPTLKRRDS